MLCGRLIYPPNPNAVTETPYINVGDIFQTLAWDMVYAQCGIPAERIVNISRYDLRTYDGEDVLLPMNGWFGTGKGGEVFPMSPKIHPIFLGYHNIRTKDAQCLPRNAVIGCRDEKTLECVSPFVRDAYLTGCMTILFPRREREPVNGKTFIVDVSAKNRKAIPPGILREAHLLSHEIRFDLHNPDGTQAEIARTENAARGFLARYRDEASLVVTSRLHCAMACIALGVPVVLLRERFDERYAFIDRFLPLYDAEEFGAIDWSPKPVDARDAQTLSMRLACSAVSEEWDREALQTLHAYYQNRIRHEIATPFLVRAYDKVRDMSPALADFIREKVLFRWTIAGSGGRGE